MYTSSQGKKRAALDCRRIDPFIQMRVIGLSQDIRKIVIVFHEYRLLYLLDTVIFEHSVEFISTGTCGQSG